MQLHEEPRLQHMSCVRNNAALQEMFMSILSLLPFWPKWVGERDSLLHRLICHQALGQKQFQVASFVFPGFQGDARGHGGPRAGCVYRRCECGGGLMALRRCLFLFIGVLHSGNCAGNERTACD